MVGLDHGCNGIWHNMMMINSSLKVQHWKWCILGNRIVRNLFSFFKVFNLTIRYCCFNIDVYFSLFPWRWVIYLWKSDLLRPRSLAWLFFTIGCSCLWSPIMITCSNLLHLSWSSWWVHNGTRDIGSVHIPASSMMHCVKLHPLQMQCIQ